MSISSPELLVSEIVRAGAGAGKTHGLTEHVLSNVEKFYRAKQTLPRMLVTTFTIKATQELKERLMLKASQRESEVLSSFVNSSSHLFISTIHGVFGQFLRKYAHTIGLDSGYEVITQTEEKKIFYTALREYLFADSSHQLLLESFNLQDLYTFCHAFYKKKLELGNLQGMDLEFLKTDLFDLQKKICSQASVHGISLEQAIVLGNQKSKALDKWRELASLLNSWSAWNDWEYTQFYKSIESSIESFGRFPSNSEKKPNLDFVVTEKVKEFWNDLKKSFEKENYKIESLKIMADNNELFFALASQVYDYVIDFKKKNAKISMSDIELWSGNLIQAQPQLAEAFSLDWDYWLIDEFQDTSPFQLVLLRKLIGDSSYFVVGDPQQSIYYFRGAEHRLFEQEEQIFREKKQSLKTLMKNYRSKPECMAFINDAMAEYGFDRMQAREESFDSSYLAAKFLMAEDRHQEKEMVVIEILKLLEEGVLAGNICILSRTNRDLQEVSQLLNQKQVSNYVHSSGSFFERREILDLLAILSFLVNPDDDIHFVQLVRSPWFYISDLELFNRENNKQTYWQFFKDKEIESVSYLHSLIAYAKDFGILAALEKAMDERGILDFSRHYDPSGKREANLWKCILALKELEHMPFFNPLEYVHMAKNIAESKTEGESEAAAALEPNRVQLMTIHASKGLEFPYVFILSMSKSPQLSKGIDFFCNSDGLFSIASPLGEEGKKYFPVSASEEIEKTKDKEREESYRLLYVAMTRAESRVYACYSRKIEKSSWMESFSWPLDSGLHKKEKYSFEVLSYEESSSDQKLQKSVEDKSLPLVPEKYQDPIYLNLASDESESVSSILQQRSEFGKQQRAPEEAEFPQATVYLEKLERAQIGTQMHKVFEHMVRRNQSFEDCELGLKESLSEKDLSVIKKAYQYLVSLQEPAFLEVTKKAKVEWGFVFKHGNRVIEGQIDLWGFDDQGRVWVLDYKTGSSRFKEKAKEQLQIYALAISKLHPEKEIYCAAIYLSSEECFVWPYDQRLHLQQMSYLSK